MSTHKDNVLAVQFIHFSIFSMKMVHTILNKSYLLLQKLKLMQGKRIKYFLFDNVLSIYIKNTCFGSLIEKNSVIDSFNTFWNTIAIYIKYYLDDSKSTRTLYFALYMYQKDCIK